MAVVRNITSDDRSLFSADAPPAKAGEEVTLADETFVDRAWPKSTWEVVKKPQGYVDASTDDAYVFLPDPEESLADLKKRAEDAGVDITGLRSKADIAAALAAGPTSTEENDR